MGTAQKRYTFVNEDPAVLYATPEDTPIASRPPAKQSAYSQADKNNTGRASTQGSTPAAAQLTMSSFDCADADLQVSEIGLNFTSVEDARKKLSRVPLTSNSLEELRKFMDCRPTLVCQIMCAIDSRKQLDPQPRSSHNLTPEEIKAWKDWQKVAHDATRIKLNADPGHKRLEARAWEMVEAFRVVHTDGYRHHDVAEHGEASCLERVKAVIVWLERLAIIRQRAVSDMDMDEFVTNPADYAKGKVASLWSNYQEEEKKRAAEAANKPAAAGETATTDKALADKALTNNSNSVVGVSISDDNSRADNGATSEGGTANGTFASARDQTVASGGKRSMFDTMIEEDNNAAFESNQAPKKAKKPKAANAAAPNNPARPDGRKSTGADTVAQSEKRKGTKTTTTRSSSKPNKTTTSANKAGHNRPNSTTFSANPFSYPLAQLAGGSGENRSSEMQGHLHVAGTASPNT